MSESSLINLDGIEKIFFTDEIETCALDGVHLEVNQGEYVSIAGPSGCGKSTLLSVIGLLSPSTEGHYFLEGEDVVNLSSSEQARVRNRQIGFIFQAFNLIGDMTVLENVELPLTYRKELKSKQRQKKAQEALEKVDMAHRMNHFPSQLSGGQQQRIAIARALSGDPKVLLADEPTGNLDSKNAEIVMGLLSDLHAQGTTICMVTHDSRYALRAKRQITLFDGKIVDDRPTSILCIETEAALINETH